MDYGGPASNEGDKPGPYSKRPGDQGPGDNAMEIFGGGKHDFDPNRTNTPPRNPDHDDSGDMWQNDKAGDPFRSGG